LDTSRGRLSMPFPHEFVHTALFLPHVAWIPLFIFAAVTLAVSQLSREAAGLGALGSLILAIILATCVRYIPRKTAIEHRLEEFELKLRTDGWKPTPCPKGAQRAITVGKLLEVHEFFSSFIRDRNAYYMDGNIFRPLTKASQLSFAEFVGSSEVQWFVSHYWGTPFTHFCESISAHALAKAKGTSITEENQVDRDRRRSSKRRFTRGCKSSGRDDSYSHSLGMAYWVCFCSINQYRIKEELGRSWKESSFFITLQSGRCRGTCMVLDTAAMPLTRSWCIFELLQTLKLEESTQEGHWEGLELCSASGLLSEGNSSFEVAINLVRRMATLDLEAADASNQQDKDMIKSLVMAEMGSFAAMNEFMQREIRRVLTRAESKFAGQFSSLFTLLDAVASSWCDSEEARVQLKTDAFNIWKNWIKKRPRLLGSGAIKMQLDSARAKTADWLPTARPSTPSLTAFSHFH